MAWYMNAFDQKVFLLHTNETQSWPALDYVNKTSKVEKKCFSVKHTIQHKCLVK